MAAVLILLAHHDDEFFLAPVIQDEVRAGHAVQVAFLTHGSIYGEDAAVRIGESDRALARLGVGTAQIAQIGAARGIFDGELSLKPASGLAELRERFATPQFARIYLMAWEGGHPDHDAAHMIGAAFAACGGAELLEFPAYNACGSPPGRFASMRLVPREGVLRERRLDSDEASAWRALVDAYPSQQRVFKSLMPGIEAALFKRQSLICRELKPAPDYGRRPHSGPLFYEQHFRLSFAEFHQRMLGLRTA